MRGFLLLSASVVFGAALLLPLLLPLSSQPSWLLPSEDSYHALLLPLLLPVLFIFIYVNWLGLKLFRHN